LLNCPRPDAEIYALWQLGGDIVDDKLELQKLNANITEMHKTLMAIQTLLVSINNNITMVVSAIQMK
jgi:hypothetical protein